MATPKPLNSPYGNNQSDLQSPSNMDRSPASEAPPVDLGDIMLAGGGGQPSQAPVPAQPSPVPPSAQNQMVQQQPAQPDQSLSTDIDEIMSLGSGVPQKMLKLKVSFGRSRAASEWQSDRGPDEPFQSKGRIKNADVDVRFIPGMGFEFKSGKKDWRPVGEDPDVSESLQNQLSKISLTKDLPIMGLSLPAGMLGPAGSMTARGAISVAARTAAQAGIPYIDSYLGLGKGLASSAFGKDWSDVHDIVTGDNRLMQSILGAGGQFIGDIASGLFARSAAKKMGEIQSLGAMEEGLKRAQVSEESASRLGVNVTPAMATGDDASLAGIRQADAALSTASPEVARAHQLRQMRVANELDSALEGFKRSVVGNADNVVINNPSEFITGKVVESENNLRSLKSKIVPYVKNFAKVNPNIVVGDLLEVAGEKLGIDFANEGLDGLSKFFSGRKVTEQDGLLAKMLSNIQNTQRSSSVMRGAINEGDIVSRAVPSFDEFVQANGAAFTTGREAEAAYKQFVKESRLAVAGEIPNIGQKAGEVSRFMTLDDLAKLKLDAQRVGWARSGDPKVTAIGRQIYHRLAEYEAEVISQAAMRSNAPAEVVDAARALVSERKKFSNVLNAVDGMQSAIERNAEQFGRWGLRLPNKNLKQMVSVLDESEKKKIGEIMLDELFGGVVEKEARSTASGTQMSPTGKVKFGRISKILNEEADALANLKTVLGDQVESGLREIESVANMVNVKPGATNQESSRQIQFLKRIAGIVTNKIGISDDILAESIIRKSIPYTNIEAHLLLDSNISDILGRVRLEKAAAEKSLRSSKSAQRVIQGAQALGRSAPTMSEIFGSESYESR